eukprot:scaffold257569_cov32-Tisochrysis_lutea.AAC.4
MELVMCGLPKGLPTGRLHAHYPPRPPYTEVDAGHIYPCGCSYDLLLSQYPVQARRRGGRQSCIEMSTSVLVAV